MRAFISCDWGTSSFRLRCIDVDTQSVLGEVTSHQGIADTYARWKQHESDKQNRFSFYQSFLKTQLASLQVQTKRSLDQWPLIISGMASSNLGIMELPYKQLPFAMDGSDLGFEMIKASEFFTHDILLISGARTNNDVMRGEEVQLIGCNVNDDEHVYIFPGTHSKHITVINQHAIDFKTFMTGEFFRLLSTQSILSKSVQENERKLEGDLLKSFERGVEQSLRHNLLHNAFLVRTNHVLGHLSKEENYYYLSGLLIGTELSELVHYTIPITVVGNKLMQQYYTIALNMVGVTNANTTEVDQALVNGHCKMYRLLF